MGSSLPLFLALATAFADSLPTVHPNDNRHAAGIIRAGVTHVEIEARWGAWRPDPAVDTTLTIRAFAERGKPPQTPGPLVRVRRGDRVHLTIRNNFADSSLVIHGLRAGTAPNDTLQLAPGATREIEFAADSAGTFLYWGSTHVGAIDTRIGRSTQLNGVIVVDSTAVDPRERILVLSLLEILPDTARPELVENVWEAAINGLSWPNTERLTYQVGDSVHWRWVNATDRVHPMHLHGFHFRVTAKGSGVADTAYGTTAERLAVTEFMLPGSTFRMSWMPTRTGNWLMHCHMVPHISPFPEQPVSPLHHDADAVAQHALTAMAGLVVGIVITDSANLGAPKPGRAVRQLRLLAQESTPPEGARPKIGFVLQNGQEPARDEVSVPGTPLILRRGETVKITVVNHLSTPTSVHWHGMELESVFDGVAGWGMSDKLMAPIVAPDDSFAVTFTPPRAGTYMYHTHMDEAAQLQSGMYGPMIVLDPDEIWDPERNLIQMAGYIAVGQKFRPALNGSRQPPIRELVAGVTYRFRIVNIQPAAPITVSLVRRDSLLAWTTISKDGAALPPASQHPVMARLVIGVGETYDFEWLAGPAGSDAEFRIQYGPRVGAEPVVQRLKVQ